MFLTSGRLPPGIHPCSFQQFAEKYDFNQRRRRYLRLFGNFLDELKARGVVEVFVGGSFVTAKALPSDIDFSFAVEAAGEKLRGLKLPTIERGFRTERPLHFLPENLSDPEGNPFKASEFFQEACEGFQRKGIIKLVL